MHVTNQLNVIGERQIMGQKKKIKIRNPCAKALRADKRFAPQTISPKRNVLDRKRKHRKNGDD